MAGNQSCDRRIVYLLFGAPALSSHGEAMVRIKRHARPGARWLIRFIADYKSVGVRCMA